MIEFLESARRSARRASQAMVWWLAVVSGSGWRTPQCSTILPSWSRKISTDGAGQGREHLGAGQRLVVDDIVDAGGNRLFERGEQGAHRILEPDHRQVAVTRARQRADPCCGARGSAPRPYARPRPIAAREIVPSRRWRRSQKRSWLFSLRLCQSVAQTHVWFSRDNLRCNHRSTACPPGDTKMSIATIVTIWRVSHPSFRPSCLCALVVRICSRSLIARYVRRPSLTVTT
jgi:hypothetical protein